MSIIYTPESDELCRFRWPPACWDCGFESLRGHGCLPLLSVVSCQVEASASARGASPSVIKCTNNPPYLQSVGRTDLSVTIVRKTEEEGEDDNINVDVLKLACDYINGQDVCKLLSMMER